VADPTSDPATPDRPTEAPDEEEICGEAYDHTLDVHYEDEDGRVLWCRECGAEIIEEADGA
jgi:hypothetical protein